MLLNDLMKTSEDVFLIESSFEGIEMNLKSLDYLDRLRCLPAGAIEATVAIKDKKGSDLGIAYRNKHPDGDFWFVIPYPHSPQMRKQTDAMVSGISKAGVIAAARSRKVDGKAFARAVREYLSTSLVEGAFCDCTKEKEPLSFASNDERGQRIRKLVKKVAKEHGKDPAEIDALEICCGNGMSTTPLRQTFHTVLSVDNDRCAICNGLYHGILVPEDTAVADAMELSRLGLGKYGAVVGFMLGAIYDFNKPVWRKIMEESVKMLNDDGLLLLTVSKEEEMGFISETLASMGIEGDVVDNRHKESIYDSWAFVAMR
ncbi:class I SAM-dependent methyltransferase [Methanocella sp. MCL-LM]|uniref:class I SAM-dependent methyltransferase n=1 Tax=Methanocella sp. MCL-LM TaxID=3412035 RepID=UPI003C773BA0